MGSSEGCIDRLYMGMPVGCVQNPVISREREWGTLVPAEQPKRVVVVGGGPAGMEAARVAASRGHQVTLLERTEQLGGAIRIASRAPGWEAYTQSIEWLERQIAKLPITVIRNHTATHESILAQQPEVVVIATGARPRRPAIPGADLPHVVTVADVLRGDVAVGQRCLILDETGYTPGPKVADLLSQAGHQVEIVTRQYSLGEDIGTTIRAKLYERLLKQGVTITVLAMPLEIRPDAVRLHHLITDAEWLVPAESVIVASGGDAQDALYHELATHAGLTLKLIGDAYAPRNLRLAMVDGAKIGREI